MMTILCVEAGPIYEVDTTANDIPSSEGWSICLPSPRATEAVSIIPMVAIRVLIPPWESVHVDPLS